MYILRKPTVPRYIYSGRLGELYVDKFAQLFWDDVENYPSELLSDEVFRKMAHRIAHVYFRELNDQICRDAVNRQYFRPKYQFVGDKGFNWPVISEALTPESTVLCAGIGGNMTFEADLALKVGCKIHLFDPSVHAISLYKRNYSDRRDLILNEVGLFDIEGILNFYKDSDPSIGSLSAVNLMGSDISFSLPVTTIESYLKSNGLVRIDYLKMDVEGAEYKIIYKLLDSSTEIDQLAFEFDQPIPPWTSQKLISSLLRKDFYPIHFWSTNAFFVHGSLLARLGEFDNLVNEVTG